MTETNSQRRRFKGYSRHVLEKILMILRAILTAMVILFSNVSLQRLIKLRMRC